MNPRKFMDWNVNRLALKAAGAIVVAFLAVSPLPASAAVTCPAEETGVDTDGDGFTDFQECTGITTAGSLDVNGVRVGQRAIPPCASGTPRDSCVDPNTKDLFVIYVPVLNGSLLGSTTTGVPAPFANVTAYENTYRGFGPLGVTVHQLAANEAGPDRSIVANWPQKAIRIVEDLDASDITLGYCQWGTPNGDDGCTVWTQRILNYITSSCAGSVIVTPSGVPTSAADVFRAYVTWVVLHETGHASGGLSAKYNSRYGGYHYAPGTGTMMEQAAVVSTKSGKCKFSISKDWNITSDQPAIRLK
jgi:hypothetical protein